MTRTENFTDFSKRNLSVIENFILHYTHGEEPLSTEMREAAIDYISEDHVDGEDSEEAQQERNNKKYIGRTVKIIANLEDHVGYNGEDLIVVSVKENDYLSVENDQGNRWVAGIEETDIRD